MAVFTWQQHQQERTQEENPKKPSNPKSAVSFIPSTPFSYFSLLLSCQKKNFGDTDNFAALQVNLKNIFWKATL